MSAQIYYSKRVEELSLKVAESKKKSNTLVIARLLSFVAIPVTIYFLFFSAIAAVVGGFVTIALFLFFVRKSVDVKNHLNYLISLLQINENELSVLNNDFSVNAAGEEYKNPQHAFSYDLDVYGRNGIFQFLNRTVSKKGSDKLAHYLENGVHNYTNYQQTTEKLKENISWTQEYRAVGQLNEKDHVNLTLDKWLKDEIKVPGWMKISRFLLPSLAILGTVLFAFEIISESYLLLVIAVCLFPIGRYLKTTNKIAQRVGNLKDRLRALNSQINLVKALEIDSKQLTEIKIGLFKGENNADEAFQSLIKSIERFDMRMNIFVSVLLNIFVAYDFQLIIGLNNWKEKYANTILKYEEYLVELEVIICMTNFRYNTPETSYPSLNTNTKSAIDIKNLGHPLLAYKKMVKNDYNLKENEFFSIITGPNMAGKSTFLRSVGVNLMLAKAGFPVMADSFEFPNLNLYSSMRTADNLTEESSYFHAELVRLRFIADAIDRGENVFIILDEILKGTNSKDKEEGSAKFLTKLVKKGAKGIIATHDLSLTELANNNETLKNQFFDSTISGDDISFSYTINNGIVQNMNASFLLKQMDLV